ncbi:hypothetical protein CA54_37500 [Symmachiella macrocystis]|uniref:Uncharacterized protein n=1 Tax=Symmachiella macrocystis TaxID=2527985 RepID=A0A5C6BRL9_9PLAN|nr:hypothetical protein [Symmachiella macrocystis]TWU14880.1 hypothetical protein CA54_37500 [Symmachiella macrocystis]
MRLHIISCAFAIITVATFGRTLHCAESQRKAPPQFKTLVNASEINFDFYDPSIEPDRFPGRALFSIEVRTRFLYEYQVVNRRTRRYVIIRPKIQRIHWKLKHTIRLPESYDAPTMWDSVLLLHELDHVAISSDPRMRMLLERAFFSVKRIEHPITQVGALDDAAIQKIINDEFIKRRDAVIELATNNYKLLDKVSAHGARDIPDRDAFFRKLYTKESLDEAGFPYLGDVVDLLNDAKYEKAKLLHHSSAGKQ